jgi:hypothetical protein
MKLKEAQQIVSTIVNWQFVLQGVVSKDEAKLSVDLKKYSLEELIKANKLVMSNNSRKAKLQEYWRNKGCETKGISQQLTLADRLIAGVYTALNFPPDNEVNVLVNDIGVGCVKVNYD